MNSRAGRIRRIEAFILLVVLAILIPVVLKCETSSSPRPRTQPTSAEDDAPTAAKAP